MKGRVRPLVMTRAFNNLSSAVEENGNRDNQIRPPAHPHAAHRAATEEQMTDIEDLLDKIEDDDDVQSVYTNLG